MREVFLVENIKCHGCAGTISTELKKLGTDYKVHVIPEDGLVEIDSNQEIDRNIVLDKLKHLGYPESADNNVLRKAQSYVSCMLGRIHTAE